MNISRLLRVEAPTVGLAGIVVHLTLAGELPAQGKGQMRLSRLSTGVELDGRVTREEWGDIETLPMTMHSPVFRGDPTERTEVRLAYDDNYLYASGRFYDSEPTSIRTNSLYRDRWSGDDVFALFVDSFNDNESALWFTVNPAGVRMDRLLGDDGATTNSSWDTYWDVETRTTDEGWFFEMRIPFSSLRFQTSDDRTVMGIIATRLVARKNERTTFPEIDPRFTFRKPSIAQDVVLEGVSGGRPAYFTPYVLSGLDRSAVPPSTAGQGFGSESSALGEIGADLKYSLTDNMFLDLTANTDFAQVEADDQQINLTRFPLFFPEKRQFFQERSDIFEFPFGAGGRFFHSRRIGLTSDRQTVRILGGARVAGRIGDWDIGFLDMQTAREEGLPTENFAVARVKRRVVNDYSYAGAMFTSRVDEGGGYNVGFGADSRVRLFGDDYATVRFGSIVDDEADFDFVRSSQFHFNWERRASRGLAYHLRLNRLGKDYVPEMGFLRRRDVSFAQLYSVYNVRSPEGGLLRSWGPGLVANLWMRNDDRSIESGLVGHWYNYEFPNGASGWMEVYFRYENVRQAFELGDSVEIPEGTYPYFNTWFNYSSGPGSLVRSELNVVVGEFYDGFQTNISFDPTWNLSRFLELSGGYEINLLRFGDRDQSLDTHLARLRIRAAVDAKLSAAALLQYNSVADAVGLNLRIRYNFREGNDLWLVYDEGLNTERDPTAVGGSRLPLSQTRALRAKFTYTFAM